MKEFAFTLTTGDLFDSAVPWANAEARQLLNDIFCAERSRMGFPSTETITINFLVRIAIS